MAGLTPPRPLAVDDDRETFDCGRDSLNQWLRRHAWRNQESGVSRTSVVCDPVTGAIVGYISLCTGQIERAFLPKARQRNQPDPLPIILLGQLAIDRQYQGRGYARSLLWFALTTALRLSKDVGCFGVLTHPLDDGLRQFYQRFGFEGLPGAPHRGMVVRMADLERSGFSGGA
jgi:GNAT superfamily N-acetyltransferase